MSGKVSAVGSYESLRESGLDFAQLLTDPEEEKNDRRNSSTSSRSFRQRQNSDASLNSVADSIYEESPMQVQESQETGSIGLRLYKKYFAAGGGWFVFTTTALSCILSQVLASGGDYYLSYWVNSNQDPLQATGKPTLQPSASALISNDTMHESSFLDDILKLFKDTVIVSDKNLIEIYIFSAITLLTVAITLSRSFLFFRLAMKSSTKLHNTMFRGITRASMYFFNTNPSGRILNRFSKDMGQIDEILPSVMMDVIQIFLSLLGIVVVVAVVNPLFLIPTLILAVIFYYLRVFYLKTSRDIKRIEGVSKYNRIFQSIFHCLCF